jgi:membrane protease YdiL (CAAX protease family)
VNCIKGFTFVNLYSAVYYLFVISFCEEVVFRGYLFNELSMKFSFAASIVISGVLFGSAHGIFAYFIYGQSAISILSYFGGGILAAIVFVFVYRKTKSLAPPILIHALLDCMPGL